MDAYCRGNLVRCFSLSALAKFVMTGLSRVPSALLSNSFLKSSADWPAMRGTWAAAMPSPCAPWQASQGAAGASAAGVAAAGVAAVGAGAAGARAAGVAPAGFAGGTVCAAGAKGTARIVIVLANTHNELRGPGKARCAFTP